MKPESIELFFREGSSDKVYKASLQHEANGWVVNFAYGRRGNTLTTGTKTPSPVITYGIAKKVYDKLIVEKTSKGYTDESGRTPFSGSIGTTDVIDTGYRVQLLNEIEEKEIDRYIYNDNFCAQEKYDGRRRLLITTGSKDATATNRKGLAIIAADSIMNAMKGFTSRMVFDCEDMGDYVRVFDALIINKDVRDQNFKVRESLYQVMLRDHQILQPVPTAWTSEEKKKLLKKIKKENAEGIVFKDIRADYKQGRPSSYGDQLKFKFVTTASCIVKAINGTKSSIALQVFNGAVLVDIGNATVYGNQKVPAVGSIVEVRYLYWYQGGSLFQPVLLGTNNIERDDISIEDCNIYQLKLKRE